MKIKIKIIIQAFFLFTVSTNVFSQTDILKFNCDNIISVSANLAIQQEFTLPAGNDYYISELGVQIDSNSQDGKLYFGIYEYKSAPVTGFNPGYYLKFVSQEINYTGGEDKTVSVNLEPGMVKLQSGKKYRIALISGTGNLYVKRKEGAVNSGIATNLENGNYENGLYYPVFSNPTTTVTGWAFNLGFIIKGNVVSSEITPKDEYLDFNCTDRYSLDQGIIVKNGITIPSGSDQEIRHIGLKTFFTDGNNNIKFAIYHGSNNLMYVSDEISVPDSGIDTFYVSIPGGDVTLKADSTYHIALQKQGTGTLGIMTAKRPDMKGANSIAFSSYYLTGQTYPDFPSTYPDNTGYAFSFGFVINGDDSTPTNINSNKPQTNIKLFPSVTEGSFWLYSGKEVPNGTTVNIYNIAGQKIMQIAWSGSNKKNIDISSLNPGIYLINVMEDREHFKTIRVIKK